MSDGLEVAVMRWVAGRADAFSLQDCAVEVLGAGAPLCRAVATRLGIVLKKSGCERMEFRTAPDPSRRRLYLPLGMSRMDMVRSLAEQVRL